MDQSTQRAKPSFSRSSVMLPFWSERGTHRTSERRNQTKKIITTGCGSVSFYRVEDGAQNDLVGAAFQDDLNVSLQETRFGEELGLCCERLGRFCAVCFPPEHRTLQTPVCYCNLLHPLKKLHICLLFLFFFINRVPPSSSVTLLRLLSVYLSLKDYR